MKLSDLNKEQAIQTLNRVEKALATKLTKSAIVAELASQKLCSPNSSGIENTLIKVATNHGYVPPLLAKLMGVKPNVAGNEKSHPWIDKKEGLPPVPPTQTSKAGPASTQKAERRLVPTTAFVLNGVNLRAISIVEIGKKSSELYLKDGTVVTSSITEETFLKNCKVLELGD
jgi:hypothetical protein